MPGGYIVTDGDHTFRDKDGQIAVYRGLVEADAAVREDVADQQSDAFAAAWAQ